MRRSMRRMLCAFVALALLASGAYALSAGDSLISLRYLTEVFFPRAVQTGGAAAGQQLQQTYDTAKGELDASQKELLTQAGGEDGSLYSSNLSPRAWSDGEVVALPAGSGFLMLEGAASVAHDGVVVDVTEGKEIASGARLTKNHRYLVAEDTSAQVTILSGAARLGVQGGYTYTEGREDPTPFYDVSQSDWYYDAVNFVYQEGLFAGMSEHEFGPSSVMNRAMVMTVFYTLAGRPEGEMAAADVSFSDVPEDAWFAPFIKWAASQQITAGTGDDTFSPGLLINREQMVLLLYSFATRYLGLTLDARADLSVYQDLDTVSVWAREAMSWAVAEGIIGSVSADELRLAPHQEANRAAVAAMLQVFTEKNM